MRLLLTRPGWTSSTADGRTTHVLRGPGAARAAVVVHDDGGVDLRQDALRSFPIFYAAAPGDLVVSDDAQTIARVLDELGPAPQAAKEFRHLGFVTGAETLHPGISQVQAGEVVTIAQGGVVSSEFERVLGATGEDVARAEDADERFHQALLDAFRPLLARLDGRQVAVPLSGGLDSRLIAVVLKELGYDNLVHFTYGIGQTAESRISAEVASSLGQRWIFVPYDVDSMRRAWAEQGAADFIVSGYSGSALPHFQDWYAVRHLRRGGHVDEDAVFLPGHTVVGNMHDEEILDRPEDVSRDEITKIVIDHHAVLQPDSRRVLSRDPAFLRKFDAHLDLIGYDGSPASRLVAIESWNLHERQAKYINNSMRTYEHFGYEWALPMLDEPVMRAWESLSPALRRNRQWYERFVAKRYAAASGTALQTFAPTSIDLGTRERMKAVLRTLGLLTMAQRVASARAYAAHPMAFQAFIPAGRERALTRTLLRGGDPVGLFADLFLADDWAPAQRLFDGATTQAV